MKETVCTTDIELLSSPNKPCVKEGCSPDELNIEDFEFIELEERSENILAPNANHHPATEPLPVGKEDDK